MKIYVDGELPRYCKECPFMIDRGELKSSRLCYEKNFVNCDCKLNPNIGYIGITKPHGCPLATTQSIKQQVREEVVEKIKEKFNDTLKHHFCPNPSSVDFITLCISEVEEFLYQVKGESNVKD